MTWEIRGKNVLLTGATNGIGLEASVELARKGARVTLVGRDPRRIEAAVADVKARSGSNEVSHLLCDFSSQASIRRLADEVLVTDDPLHVLINNAGGVNKKRSLTVDGIETTFAVNHLG
jgi:NAD(P)-dependent dehydrogenase (short-subunit alcohol dehydrogenase family)